MQIAFTATLSDRVIDRDTLPPRFVPSLPGSVASATRTSELILSPVSAAPPPSAPATPIAPLERWELAGPFPEAVGVVPSQDPAPLAVLPRARAERTGGRAAAPRT